MRDYLYLWHDPRHSFVVASGLEFRDFAAFIAPRGGVVLLKHRSAAATRDTTTSLNSVRPSELPDLAAEDISSWGDFTWADYAGPDFPSISDDEISELLFFAQMSRPLHRVDLPRLRNQFLAAAHDDGWYLRLYYTHWELIEALLDKSIPASMGRFNMEELRRGTSGFLIQGGVLREEEMTHDVDKVLRRIL